jgi:hypothetical protein
MEWAIASLFGLAAVLLILSYFNTRKSARAEQREINSVYVSLMEENNKLLERIRQLELDAEITAYEANVIGINSTERIVLRELLDLYKRGYTIEGIAEKVQLNEKEIQYLLAPYMGLKSERRKVANDS